MDINVEMLEAAQTGVYYTVPSSDKTTSFSLDKSAIVLSYLNEITPKAVASIKQSEYIQPSLANYIDAPLPFETSSDQVVGVYGNILYPQDKEQIQLKKLIDWVEVYSEDSNRAFPLSPKDFNDISLFILERVPVGIIRHHFAKEVYKAHSEGLSLEDALEQAKQEMRSRAELYKKAAQNIPSLGGRYEIFSNKLAKCANQIDQIIKSDVKAIQLGSERVLKEKLESTSTELIEPPFNWDTRVQVFKQMVDKVTSVSPNSSYFLALQEVTPQALGDLKKALADRNIQWVSFNNMSGKETLQPQQEEVLGEAGAFTSTLALSPDLRILKVELGDLPTESGSIRKILGVRVQNTHTNKTFNLFTTHTDHEVKNDIYLRTASKIHDFTQTFFKDIPVEEQRYVIGGDLNAFEGSGATQYLSTLRELLPNSKDFRETDYYAPYPIAWSTYIGRGDDSYAAEVGSDGKVEPSALDHVIVGNGIKLQAASKEALVYNEEGELLDYYSSKKREYIENLQKRITFSDHFFNIVRFD